jgi:hypothetical protein
MARMFFSGTRALCADVGLRCAGGALALLAWSACAGSGSMAAPIFSKDGSVAVYAPVSKAGYRAPVLVFVDRTRESLQRAVRLKLGTQVCPLEVAVGGNNNGDTRVLTARLRDADGSVRERIELPDPEAADLGLFRRAVCVALLRAWMVEAGGTDATMRDLPVWLVDGVVRFMDRDTRQPDVDRALLLWSHACLPAAEELFAEDSLAATREPAVAAVFAGWFLDKRPEGSPFEALLRGAAKGTAWSPARAARLLAGAEGWAAFDEAADARFLEVSRQVIKPGLTTRGIVRRFRAHLLLYPGDCGKLIEPGKACLTLQELACTQATPELRQIARNQAAKVRMAAFGRDGMLLAVSEAYALFLEAFARGAKPGELSNLLMKSEQLRGELERKTANGGVLQRELEG